MQKKISVAVKTFFYFLFLITVGCSLNYLLSALNIVNSVKTASADTASNRHNAGIYLKENKTAKIAYSASGGIIRITLAQAIKRALANQGNILEAEHIISEKRD